MQCLSKWVLKHILLYHKLVEKYQLLCYCLEKDKSQYFLDLLFGRNFKFRSCKNKNSTKNTCTQIHIFIPFCLFWLYHLLYINIHTDTQVDIFHTNFRVHCTNPGLRPLNSSVSISKNKRCFYTSTVQLSSSLNLTLIQYFLSNLPSKFQYYQLTQ